MNREIPRARLWDTIDGLVKERNQISKDRDTLIEALKKIRDSEENVDLWRYAVFCKKTAMEALEEIDSTSTPSTPEKQGPLR